MTPWTIARQALLSTEFSRPPGDLSDPGIEPGSPALQVDSLPSELPGKLRFCFDPSVVSKRNFSVEYLPAIKCNPSSIMQELLLTKTEKRCGKIFFLEPLTIFGFGPEFHSF